MAVNVVTSDNVGAFIESGGVHQTVETVTEQAKPAESASADINLTLDLGHQEEGSSVHRVRSLAGRFGAHCQSSFATAAVERDTLQLGRVCI